MTVTNFMELLNSHLPDSFGNQFSRYEDDGEAFLKSKSGDIKIFMDRADDRVTGVTLITSGVPFLGITAEEMFEHATLTLVTIIAMIQSYNDPKEFEDYASTHTIAKILGLMDKTNNGSLDKSYQKNGIRYVAKSTVQTGIITFSIYDKTLDKVLS